MIRVALVYSAAVFAVLQVADLVVEPLHLPAWTMTLCIVLAAIGFPIALVLAWAYDLAPDPEPSAAGTAPVTARWLGARTVVAVVVILAAGVAAGWFLKPDVPTGDVAGALAVLPFENLSGDPATSPFVAGLHDDLLTRLASVSALRVIARASVRQYEAGGRPVRVIARELGVASVLSGGVQRLGDKVRVNVQLVDGTTEQQLWAERFDRDLTAVDLFAIQTEITEAIAAALSTRVTAAERAVIARAATDDIVAYDLYLRGHAAFEEAQLGGKDYSAAIELYRRATQQDARFAQAWARLAATWMHAYYWRNEGVDDIAPARAAVQRARALDADVAEAHWAQALVHYYGTQDLQAALAELWNVQPERSGSAEVLLLAADILSRVGRRDEGLALALRATRLDPRSPATAARVSVHLREAGRYDDARATIEAALAYSPRSITLHLDAAELLAVAGDWEGAKERMRAGFRVVPDGAARLVDALLPRLDWIDAPHFLEYLFELDEFRAALERVTPAERFEPGSYHLAKARLHRAAGREALARAHYDSALAAATAGVEEQRRIGRPQVAYYLPQVAFAYAGLGRFDEAVAAAEETVRLRPSSADRWDGEWALGNHAAVLLLAGDHDRAIDILAQILDRQGAGTVEPITPGILRTSPFWAPLRKTPRFEQLLADDDAR